MKRYFQTINRNIDSYQPSEILDPLDNNNSNNQNINTEKNNNSESNVLANSEGLAKKNSISSSSSTSTSSSVTPTNNTTTTTTAIISCSSSVLNVSNNHINLIEPVVEKVLINQPVKFLSTFIPSTSAITNKSNINSLSEVEQNLETESKLTNKLSNDIGYYGSSDYSDNNNSFNQPSNNTKQHTVKQCYSNRNKCESKTIYSNQHQRIKYVQASKLNRNMAVNSTTSFTSSSVLSSPTSSSSSTSSESPLFATSLLANTLSNKEDLNIKKIEPQSQAISSNIYSVNSLLSSTKNTDVKVYLERFERIYNSGDLNNEDNSKKNSNGISSFNNVNNKQHRNSLTSYSYV